MSYFNKYIKQGGADGLLHYKYACRDDSLIYRHVTNRWFVFCMNFVPEWMAPNLITFLGFLFTVFGHIYFMSFTTTGTEAIPSNVIWTYAACVFIYATMDALDGKQARRTGSSSPLGLMFDHGCDCIQTTLLSLCMACMFQLGYTWKMFLLWFLAAIGFFLCTFEEYYTGMMYLPIINGPTEGLLVTLGLIIGTGFQNMEDPFWLQPAVLSHYFPMCKDWTRQDDMLVALFILIAPTALGNIINIRLKINTTKRSEDQPDPRFQFRVALTRCFPLVFAIAIYFVWFFFSGSDVFIRHGRALMYTLGCVHSKMLMGLMIAHLTDLDYYPFGKTSAVIMIVGAFMVGVNLLKTEEHDQATLSYVEDIAVSMVSAISTFSLLHLILSVIWEMSSILKIRVFCIPSKKKDS